MPSPDFHGYARQRCSDRVAPVAVCLVSSGDYKAGSLDATPASQRRVQLNDDTGVPNLHQAGKLSLEMTPGGEQKMSDVKKIAQKWIGILLVGIGFKSWIN